MVLCIDIGNTNTKVGAFDDKGVLVFVFSFATDSRMTPEQVEVILKHGFAKNGKHVFAKVIVSSVVRQATAAVLAAVREVCGVDAMCVPLDKGVGADIYCTMNYVKKTNFPLPAAIFSLGTATTMVVLGEDGELLGGMIYPGVMTSVVALSERASSLPQVQPEVPSEGFLAKSTVGAMQSGMVYGTAAMMDGLADRVREEYGVKTLIMSGGMSGLIGGQVRNKFIMEENIVLKGCYHYGEEEN